MEDEPEGEKSEELAILELPDGEGEETSRTDRLAFDDGSFQVRSACAQGQPTVNEHREHMTTRRLFRSWCQLCVMGRKVSSPKRRSVNQYDVVRNNTCVHGL